eukprot:6179274-Pleurochrysis_carterae.AAC.2
MLPPTRGHQRLHARRVAGGNLARLARVTEARGRPGIRARVDLTAKPLEGVKPVALAIPREGGAAR